MRSSILTISIILFLIAPAIAQAQSKPVVLVAYYSPSGHTKAMAEAVARGAETGEVEVVLRSIEDISEEDVLKAGAIVLGSPVYNANIAPAVQEFINSWPFEGRPLKDKIGAAFATGGGISIGEELVMLNIIHSMLIHGMVIVGGQETEAAFGASAITGEGEYAGKAVQEVFLKKAEGLGKRVAEMVVRMSP
ncbi:flavodoxin family protein [Litoribacter ruber]|uniref:flavodoxin family protein n=1 Tax=Litoribacter ruber TaxID=702568 RepID=UPI001BD97C52|nr:flavodoxin family protein [Litoribacter ruber]MBT0812671.1 flavodoxin family protein [Litoribacter ruber]